MEKLSRKFLGNEVLVCGCSVKDNLYYKRIYKAFSTNGIKVYPMPTSPESELGFETYKSFADLPKTPKTAYVLSHKNDTPSLLKELYGMGVRKVLFYGPVSADEATLKWCADKGIETRMGCPMMLFGGGPCWLHSVFAGVKRG